ncbi:CaiB/BaiF CoA transferase family protein [Sphingomonas profundi]|uniref:CaiB/BaiF CoA transferase family protein n=1 Tax=Alterirhizorhabdus profundi TaxID=2681549 RepID=UPI001E5F3ECA|nr:CoA transferase [Sphingomonas profundi]
MASWHTAPMAAAMLGDLGADVIKIEAPQGDEYRVGGTSRAGFSIGFMMANRNKRSIMLDLKDPAQQAIAYQLIAKSDVLVHNLRPGTMERLGFGADRLRGEFPALIYASISGYGPSGPRSADRAFDPMIQGMTGMAHLQKNAEGRPQLIKTLVADKVVSPMLAQALCAALYRRAITGKGATIELAMLDGLIWWMWPDAMANHSFRGEGVSLGADISEADFVAPTLDGHIVLAPHMQSAWQAFLALVERPDLAADPRFATMRGRIGNLRAFSGAIQGSMTDKTTAEWCRLLAAADIPCAPVYSIGEVADDPQVAWNGILEDVDHPVAGSYRGPMAPVVYDGTRTGTWRHVPSIGEHTDEILREFGIVSVGDQNGSHR